MNVEKTDETAQSSEQESSLVSGGPILLFDGVCNLCDASVQFVIDRDSKKQFRFASLQSNAAQKVLDEVGAPASLPDSLVLVDGKELFTQSDAVIRTARALGFPFSLLVIGLILPKFIRDPLYVWVARNRYRWFGKQNACRIPTPELRARFLDAGETPPAVSPQNATDSADEAGEDTSKGFGLGTLPRRFLLVYPVVFLLPFPIYLLSNLSGIPGLSDTFFSQGIDFVVGLHSMIMEPIVSALGSWWLGEEINFRQTGSGDGLKNYLDVVVDLAIALVISIIWIVARRNKPISPVTADVCRTWLRYFLVYIMMAYGLGKVFPMQFSSPGPDRLLQPFGDSSPMGLLWTFMGASTGYQMFGGLAEVLGGLLLCFRRTTLAGSLVVIAVMTNVFALNIFFDVPVKLYSFHYLMFAVILLLPDLPRLVGLLLANVPVAAQDLSAPWATTARIRRIAVVVKAVLIIGIIVPLAFSYYSGVKTRGPWAPKHPMSGIYRVESFNLDGLEESSLEPSQRWIRVGLTAPWVGTVQHGDGTAVRMRMRLDMEAGTLRLYDRSLSEPPKESMTFTQTEDDLVVLTGVYNGQEINVTLRRVDDESLLTNRGFHWINEYPYNR